MEINLNISEKSLNRLKSLLDYFIPQLLDIVDTLQYEKAEYRIEEIIGSEFPGCKITIYRITETKYRIGINGPFVFGTVDYVYKGGKDENKLRNNGS